MLGETASPNKREPATVVGCGTLARWCGAFALSAALTACDTAPVKPTAVPAPAITSLQEYMQQASKASAEGSREKARDTYRAAAKAYPASNEPWSRLAEDYFAASDYGNAILAAQEVLLRDVLGEDVLVPRPATAAPAPKPRSAPRAHAPAPAPAPAAAVVPAPASPPPPAKSSGNPFDKLPK